MSSVLKGYYFIIMLSQQSRSLDVVSAKSEDRSGVSQYTVLDRHPGRTRVAEAGFAALTNAIRWVVDVATVSTVGRTTLAHVAAWFSTTAARQTLIFVIIVVSIHFPKH